MFKKMDDYDQGKISGQTKLCRDVDERIVPRLAFSLYFDQNFKNSFHADAD